MKKVFTLFFVFSFFFSALPAQNLVDVEYLESRTQAELVADYGFFIQFGADMYRVTYETPDIHGVMDTASGLFIYPVAESNDREFPMLIYQHGTVGSRFDVPSELAGGFELALFWAGVGYATTAADFLGLGEARGFHPYVHSRTEASAAIDMHLAIKDYIENNGLYVNEQLFVTGYSQGGHGAAAVQKMIQENYAGQLEVTASAPMSGPYSISGVMRDLMLGDEPYFFVGYAPYSVLSYNLEYDFFEETNEVFKEPVASWVQQFYDEEIDLWEMNDSLISWLTVNFGGSVPKHMFHDSIIDKVTNNPNHPINQGLRDNDLLDWAPVAPTRLYYCTADDQVPFMNSVIAEDSLLANGAVDLEAIDANSDMDHGGCVQPAVSQGFIFFSGYQNIGFILNNVELDQAIQFQVVPNPASNEINIRFESDFQDFDQIELINLNGQTLRSLTSQTTMNINDLPQGVYFVKVTSEDGVWIEKLMKN